MFPLNPNSDRPIIIWLLGMMAMIFVMVIIGGITRLTDSGLSIVDWRPIMGAIPPLSEAEWTEAFTRYQNFPEFQKINYRMTLDEFKGIFFWEYFHRLWGRLIGLAFFFPFALFWIKKKLTTPLKIKLSLAFIIGGLQGLMGWYMVKSGLVSMPDVSHYRLAAHLGLAFLSIGFIWWIILDLAKPSDGSHGPKTLWVYSLVATAVIALQIFYGAFTAGLKAGHAFNTFPKMGADWLATAAFYPSIPYWQNFLENPAGVQFIHRCLGWIIFLIGCGCLYLWAKKQGLTEWQRKGLAVLGAAIFIQFLLGVATLLLMVPVPIALIHQAGACMVLLAALTLNHSLR